MVLNKGVTGRLSGSSGITMGSEPPEDGFYNGASTGGRHPDSDLRRSTSVVLDDKEKR